MKLLVYGSLKMGKHAHFFMENCEAVYLGEAVTTKDYSLYNLGVFPGMVEEPSEVGVHGELYEFPDDQIDVLDRYEGVASGLFEKKEVTLENGDKATAYLYANRMHTGKHKVATGIW